MYKSFCLLLFLILFPHSHPAPLPSRICKSQPQSCCDSYYIIKEIQTDLSNFNTSVPIGPNECYRLKDVKFLMSNLAAFRNASDKFVSISNSSLAISKNLKTLENILQKLPIVTLTYQEEEDIQIVDFGKFPKKLNTFLGFLYQKLKSSLNCSQV